MKVMLIFELEDNELIRDKFNEAICEHIGFDKVVGSKELVDDSHLKNDKKYKKIHSTYKEAQLIKDEYVLNNK